MAFPPPQPASQAGPYLITHERGPMTRQVKAAVLAQGGEAAWHDLLFKVSPACRARFSAPIGYFDWVESPLALELHQARLEQLGGAEFMAERGEQAAREILSGPQAWLLRMATPGILIQSLPRLLTFYYRGPQGTVRHLEEGLADLEMRASGYPDTWYEQGLGSFLRVALALTGARHPTVDYAREGEDLHRMVVKWEKR